MIQKLSSLFLLLLVSFSSFASLPDIVNFGTKEYNSHSINYCFAQDTNGIMYVGNAYGVLEYDGQYWRKIPVNDGKSAISMDVDSKGRVYVGSSSEFGYLSRNERGINEYISLKNKLPNLEMGEILDLVCVDDGVYFRGLHNIFCFKSDSVYELSAYDKDILTYYLGVQNKQILAAQLGVGILHIKGLHFQVDHKEFKHEVVKDILVFDNERTLYVTKDGIVSNQGDFSTVNEYFKRTAISTALKLNETEFLLGTETQGVFHLNINGDIISHFTVDQGLQDNFIHDLFLDKSGNVWLAYNKGLGLIKWNSPVRYIPTSMGIEGMGYSAIIYNDTLYVGTSRGLYYLSNWEQALKKQQSFVKVKGIENTINELKIQNDVLIACQAAEVYQVNGDKVTRLSPGLWYGSWSWKPSNLKNEAFVGTYLGLAHYQFRNKKWVFDNDIKGFSESSRVFEIDKNGVLWVVQGNKGLYRVQLNVQKDSAVSVVNYAELMGKDAQYFNDIFTYHDSIFVSSYGSTYAIVNDSLIEQAAFSDLGNKAHRIRKYKEDGLYSIYEDQAHLLQLVNNKWQVKNTTVSFLKSYLVGSAEFFYELAENFYLIGTQDGFAIYTPTQQDNNQQIPCLIRGIELLTPLEDSLIFSYKPTTVQEFNYQDNNLRITYSIPLFGENNQITYETRLYKNGSAMHHWQQVNNVNFKEYTNLKEGDYKFWVRAKKGDAVAGVQSLEFKVLPPWYRTGFAYFIYFLLWVVAILFVIKLFFNQKKKLEAESKKELEIKEKLHNAEKLELELKNKENELAYMALTYTQKKELLANLTNQLNKISKDMNHEDQIKFRSVKSAIANNLDDEKNWDNFQVHFDEKNDNFFQKLKQKEKRMNESYLLFCSYVRMGKSNKEIAELLNISVAAVEKRKYRLKKKWDLPDDTSFTEYLRNL